MYNLGDDSELDRLSKEASGRYQHPGKPDWPQMEAELDKVLPAEKKRRFGAFWLLPALLAVGGATYWLTRTDDSNKTAQALVQPVAKTSDYTTKPASVDNAEAQTASPKDETVAVPNESRKNSIASAIETPQPVKQQKVTPSVNQKNDNITPATTPGIDQPEKRSPVAKQEQVEKPNTANTAAVLTQTNKETSIQQTTSATEKGAVTTATEKTDNKRSAEPEQPQPAISSFNKEPEPFGKGWSAGLVVGIDQSTVKFAYSSAAGYNAGITVGYHFNNRWSVHTGAIYTHKNYKMNGADFTPPKGSWVNYYKIENVNGDCSMWEVPLLVRYGFAQHGRHSFFASTGLSSYFMTHENYSYFYYFNNQPVTRSMAYTSDDTHILSILHLSAGYEHQLSNKMSMIIEPYAKLPLAGVGLGNIQLSSFGLNFSFQWRQPAHK